MQGDQISNEFEGRDAVLAQELLDLRSNPSESLWGRIEAITGRQTKSTNVLRRWAWALTALLLAAFLVSSPVARATWGELEEIIGRIYFTVTDRLPDNSEANLVEGESLSIQEAQEAVPFDFALPDYIPDGYSNGDLAELWRPNDLVDQVVEITWRHPDGNLIELSVHAYDSAKPIHTLVGPDSIETVMIAGREAALIRGGWNSDSGSWSFGYQTITLLWELNGVQYVLLGYGEGLSVDELLAVAESIHP